MRCKYSEQGLLVLFSGYWDCESKKEKRGTVIPFKSKVNHDCIGVLWDGNKTSNLFAKRFIELIEEEKTKIIDSPKVETVRQSPYIFYTPFDVR